MAMLRPARIVARYVSGLLFAGYASSACTLDLKGANEASDTAFDRAAEIGVNHCPDEAKANDTLDTATPIKANVPVPGCMDNKDIDFYEVTVPESDLAGGYFNLSVVDVGKTGLAELQVTSDTDDAPLLINVWGDNRGGPTFGFLAAAPGSTYRVSVNQFSNWVQPWLYTLHVDYTAIEDMHEPNDTRDDAAPIVLGEPVEGYLFAGRDMANLKEGAWDDWYEVVLAPGTVTMHVTSFPRNAIVELAILDPTGTSIRPQPEPYAANRGADLTASANITAAGAYKIKLTVFSTPPATSGKTDVRASVPDSFTRPYSLVVTQSP